MHRIEPRAPSDEVLRYEEREAHEGHGEQVGQDEGGASVRAGEVGELPDIAEADGRPESRGKGAYARGESFSAL